MSNGCYGIRSAGMAVSMLSFPEGAGGASVILGKGLKAEFSGCGDNTRGARSERCGWKVVNGVEYCARVCHWGSW